MYDLTELPPDLYPELQAAWPEILESEFTPAPDALLPELPALQRGFRRGDRLVFYRVPARGKAAATSQPASCAVATSSAGTRNTAK
ncbi:hypothetical protein [Deinococcus radiophilus]|uniref:hypothetical protein n=1 Tax=Deinococcus radiophilus TaxID=32062 RepID=UPI00361D978D